MLAERNIIEFGRFRLYRHDRSLLADGVKLDLGARAFDLLVALIDAGGALVSKDELLNRVWPDAIVEENNLHVQVFALRRALGADQDLIRTVPRHGYRFTGSASATDLPGLPADVAAGLTVSSASNLPIPVGELIGREADLRQIVDLEITHRLVTLSGPGGIGKTSLALAAAWRLADRYPDSVRLVDLATLADPNLVLPAIAAALDLGRLPSPLRPHHVAAALGARQVLLVLDTCEHVIDPVARIAEVLLHGTPHVQILATSREPLRAEGECVYRVPALTVPGTDVIDAEAQLRHGAVRLFVARARLADARLELVQPDDELVAAISSICRRLDGIPLALELAAARAVVLGVQAVAAGLDDRFRLLTSGRRTALPRHRTLRATLDWSYDLLAEAEQAVLRNLAVFNGPFTLEAAEAVAPEHGVEADQIADIVVSLVDKSLIISDTRTGDGARYRLLDTTRSYLQEKLSDAPGRDIVARRHVEFFRRLLERVGAQAPALAEMRGYGAYAEHVGNVRAGLEWCFSQRGDIGLGVALAAAAAPLFLEMSLLAECRGWAEKALAAYAVVGENPRDEMELQASLGLSSLFTEGNSPTTLDTLNRALTLAEGIGELAPQLRLIGSVHLFYTRIADFRGSARARRTRPRCRRPDGRSGRIGDGRMDAGCVPSSDRRSGKCDHSLRERRSAPGRVRSSRYHAFRLRSSDSRALCIVPCPVASRCRGRSSGDGALYRQRGRNSRPSGNLGHRADLHGIRIPLDGELAGSRGDH